MDNVKKSVFEIDLLSSETVLTMITDISDLASPFCGVRSWL